MEVSKFKGEEKLQHYLREGVWPIGNGKNLTVKRENKGQL